MAPFPEFKWLRSYDSNLDVETKVFYAYSLTTITFRNKTTRYDSINFLIQTKKIRKRSKTVDTEKKINNTQQKGIMT